MCLNTIIVKNLKHDKTEIKPCKLFHLNADTKS